MLTESSTLDYERDQIGNDSNFPEWNLWILITVTAPVNI